MIYFDSTYLAKCYLPELGHGEVRSVALKAGSLQSVALAKIEVASVFHRHLREGRLRAPEVAEHMQQFSQDCTDGIVSFLPVTPELLETIYSAYQTLPATLFLRSADCLHLCAAADAGFKEIYSNDRHLLAAAPHFGLRPMNVIPPA